MRNLTYAEPGGREGGGATLWATDLALALTGLERHGRTWNPNDLAAGRDTEQTTQLHTTAARSDRFQSTGQRQQYVSTQPTTIIDHR